MPDGTPNLTGTPTTTATAEGILASQQGREGDLKAALSQYAGKEAQASETETKQLESLEGEAGRLTPQTRHSPPPVAKSTDPHVVWGSMAMAIAALGSLMTRTPLTTAMNAAADVVTAYGKKDQAAADQAFQTWKVATDNYIKTADFQQKAYDEALAGIERRERMTIEEKANADRQAEAQLRGVMTAFGDETGLARMEVGGLNAVQHLIDQRAEWNDKFKLQLPKLEEQNAFMKAVLGMEADPRFQQLQQTDPVKAYQAIEAIKASVAPSMQMKPDQVIQASDKIQMAVTKTPVYKDWSFANEAEGKINSIVEQLKDGSISQTVAADQFTQVFNGGRAIRGFQMTMLTGHQSLGDQLNVAIKRLQSGGGLSNDQIEQMRQAAQLTLKFETRQMHGVAASAAAQAMDQHLPKPQDAFPLDYRAYLSDHPEDDPLKFGEGVPAPAGGGGALPKDLPDPKGQPEKRKMRDAQGNVIAIIRNGQWVAPDGSE